MKINTAYFGQVEIEDSEIINFPEGLPAFEHLKQFIILDAEEEIAFRWLQSLEDENIAFVIINPFLFKFDYEFKLSDHVLEKLKIESEADVAVYSIVVIPEKMEDITANLLAPVVINVREKLGKQIVLENTAYHTKHKIAEEAGKETC